MPERKVTVPMPDGTTATGSEILIKESSDRWSEVTLEDGSVFRVKPIIASAVRVDGQYDSEGNPIYFMKGSMATAMVSVPPELRKNIETK